MRAVEKGEVTAPQAVQQAHALGWFPSALPQEGRDLTDGINLTSDGKPPLCYFISMMYDFPPPCTGLGCTRCLRAD